MGESGCGKTVTNLSLLRLIPMPPRKIVSGSAVFKGRDLVSMSGRDIRSVRGNRISTIFQDPMTSLNPFLRISRQMTEVLELHQGMSRDFGMRPPTSTAGSGFAFPSKWKIKDTMLRNLGQNANLRVYFYLKNEMLDAQ